MHGHRHEYYCVIAQHYPENFHDTPRFTVL